MNISVTDRGTAKRCPRQWKFVSNNGLGLYRRDSVPTQFAIGTAVHLAFAAHSFGLEPQEVSQAWMLAEEKRILANGMEGDTELQDKLYTARELTMALVTHYFDYWGWDNPLAKQGLKYVTTEVPLQATIPGTDGFLIGTLDGVAKDESGNYWIIEHKTYSKKPDQAFMAMNDQMTAYMWLFSQVFGTIPAGVVYDGVAKKVPTIPRLLKNGTLSQAWIDTTAGIYVRTLQDYDLDPDDYTDIIARLQDRDAQEQNPFFTRWLVTIPKRSLITFEHDLPIEYRYMVGLRDSQVEDVMSNKRWEGCWDCGVRDLCQTLQVGGDLEYMIDNFYVTSGGHQTVTGNKIGPGEVSSPEELSGRMPNLLRAIATQSYTGGDVDLDTDE